MGIRKVILPIVFSIILISGTTPAFAGTMDGPPPPPGPLPGTMQGFEDNYVHACWMWTGPSDQTTGPNCNFNGDPYYGASSVPYPFSNVPPQALCFNGSCHIELPNWIDELPFKDIKITVNYEGQEPGMPRVTCHDPTGTTSGTYRNTMPAPGTVMWFFECEPNPDWEEIDFTYPPDTQILNIEIWTTSYDEPVSGIGIPIDTTALLLASAQSISLWMIPVVLSGIGIGVFVIKRRI